MTYQSAIPTLSYTSNMYNLGSFLRDNSRDIYVAIGYQPLRNLHFNLTYELQEHGKDVQYGQVEDPYSVPLLTGLTWRNQSIGVSAKYEFINNAFLFLEFSNRQISVDEGFSPPGLGGTTNMINAGFNIGF
jgi:hypothetical protein